MDGNNERFKRASEEYRAQLSRRPGQNEARLAEIEKDKLDLEAAKASSKNQCRRDKQEIEKQIRNDGEAERRALEEKHAKQLADLLKAQEVEKEYRVKNLSYTFEMAKNVRAREEAFDREYREKEKRLTEKWAQQKVSDPLFPETEICKNVSRLVRH
jgi:hypothetical protein